MLSRVTKRIEASTDSRYQQNEREKNFEKKVPSQKFADYVSGYLDYAHYHDRNFFLLNGTDRSFDSQDRT